VSPGGDGGEAALSGSFDGGASFSGQLSGGSSSGGSSSGSRAREKPGWKRRWTILAMCFVAFLLCNMDRVNMSIAILPISQQYGWSSTTIGLVQSSFFWGYLLTQVAGGVWADRFGGKRVLGFGVVWWSLATMATPIAARTSLPVLLAARACMGIGEGVAMPAMNNLLSKWVPVRERSRSLSLVYSGMYTGSMLGLALSPQMISSWGWASVFYVFGAAGLLWFAWWQRQAAPAPSLDPRIDDSELRYITRNTAAAAPLTSIPWRLLLSKPATWALIVSHFCHNWGTFILLTWMPTYYNQVLGLDLKSSGFFSVLPWITMAISANVGGWIADTLVERGLSVTAVRKIMQTIGFLGPAFFLTRLGGITTVTGAVGCMMAAQGLDAFSQSGLYSNHADIGPRYAGVLLGLSNTAGVLAGVLGTAATGLILQTGSWKQVWAVAVALYLVGTVVWNLFATGERVFD
jgi:ACS family sodium-dependent inorganic phosphate cotransporter